jgi:hypothetical protein
MPKFLLLLGMLGVVVLPLQQDPQSKNDPYERAFAKLRAIKVSISAGGGRNFGPVREFFRMGEPIIIVVFMTNTGNETTSVEIADTYYQNRPKLTKESKEVPYRQEVRNVLKWKDDQGCGAGRHAPTELVPNEKAEADFLVLMQGQQPTKNIVWYDELEPGNYELSIRRRFGCWLRPEAESNTIRFQVVR